VHNVVTKVYNQPNPQVRLNYGPLIVHNCLKLGFLLSKSKSFRPVLIKRDEYVGDQTISTKFYKHPNPPGILELWPLSCLKLGFPLSKPKSFRPVLIKLGEYVGGHNISNNFYNLQIPPGTAELWPLNCPKTE